MRKTIFIFLIFVSCIETLNIENINIQLDSIMIDSIVTGVIDTVIGGVIPIPSNITPAPEDGLVSRFISTAGVNLSGSSVTSWEDQVGSFDLTPPGTAPIFVEDQINGLPCIRIAGSGDVLSNLDFSLDQPNTVVLVMKMTSVLPPSANQIYYGSNAAGTYQNIYYESAVNHRHYAFAGSAAQVQRYAYNIWFSEYVEFNGASSKHYLNGTQRGSGNANTQSKNDLVLGGSHDGSSPSALDIAELLIYNKVLTSEELTQLNNYIKDTYNLTENIQTGSFNFTNTLNSTSYPANYAYDINKGTSQPVLLVFPGVGSDQTTITTESLSRMAGYGFFACTMDLGDNIPGNVGGDLSYSPKDVLTYIRANFSNIVSSTKASCVGYSGGGAVALCVAARFPDLFSVVVDYFGPSDYGYNDISSWYFTNTSFQTQMNTQVGTPREDFIDEYHARRMRDVVGKNFQGELFIFHETGDALVSVIQSESLVDRLYEDVFTDYTYRDNSMYSHGYPNDTELIQTEGEWASAALSAGALSMPTSGTIRVAGFIETGLFTIELNSYGIDAVIDVTYNTSTKSYTCTPVSATVPISVHIIQGVDTATQDISMETVITL